MTISVASRSVFTRGQPRSLQETVLPAPLGGIDARYPYASNRPENCIYAYNLVPDEFGLQSREGFREWVTGCQITTGLGVRTIIPYRGTSGVDEKLFAVTNEGIWDATASSGSPTRIFAFIDTSDLAGWGHYVHYTTDAATTRLFYADSQNGLLEYDPVLNNWSVPSGITGPDLSLVAFIVQHKQRLWMVERNSTSGWYLDVGAISGPATKFTFGSKFKHGGELVGLYSWTLDSGAGVDDILVAVSRAGDVLPYEGEDPAFAVSWSGIGSYYVGDIPVGRRIAGEVGGDMHLISSLGLTSMRDLLKGATSLSDRDSLTAKISRLIRADVRRQKAQRGWEIKSYPAETLLLINTPLEVGERYIQYRLNTAVEGWGFWRDVPALTFDMWQGDLVFGTLDNRVMRMDTTRDNGTLADPGGGDPIEFSMLHNFFNLNSPARFKWGEVIRPDWISKLQPTFGTQFLYDYKIGETVCPVPISQAASALWDAGIWDLDVWGPGATTGFSQAQGSWGVGRTLSVAICGSCVTRTSLISTDIMWREGRSGF